MFDRLLKSLLAPQPAPLADADARLALTALLVRIARADHDYAGVEIARIEEIVAARYGLSADDANALRREAELMEEAAPDTVRFTRAIKDAVDYDDRRAVVEAAWSVVLSDGARDDAEDALMRLVANLLGVNDRDSNLARQKAAQAQA